MTREDIEAQAWIGEQRAAVVALLDRAEKAEAERDAWEAASNKADAEQKAERDAARAEAEKYLQNIEERQRELTTLVDTIVVRGEQAAAERAERAEAMADPTALHESSMAVHGALGWGFDPNTVSPVSLARASASLASEHMRLRSERDLLTAQLADVTRQRDECAAGLLATREAFKRLADAVIESEDLHEANDLGYDNPPYECQDGECSCELPNLINKTLANPTAGAAWLEAKQMEAVREFEAGALEGLRDRFASSDVVNDDIGKLLAERDARVAAKARRAALNEAADAVGPGGVASKFISDGIRALAPPAPAPSGDEDPCDCDHEPDEEHKANCCFWGAPPAAKPVCATCGGPLDGSRCDEGCHGSAR